MEPSLEQAVGQTNGLSPAPVNAAVEEEAVKDSHQPSPSITVLDAPDVPTTITEDEQHRTEDEKHRTEDEQHCTEDEKHRTEDEKHRTEDEQHRTEDEKHRTEDEQHRTEDEQHRTEDEQHRTEDEQHRTEDEQHRTEETTAARQPEDTFTSHLQSAVSTSKLKHAGVVAKRPSRSGQQIIHEASNRVDQLASRFAAAEDTFTSMVAPVSLNAQYKTIPEENAEFRAKNRIRSSYRGPVFTVEDVCVPCHACGGPVDPVRRVPVGSLFFHESCLQCYLCGRREGTAGLYVQVDRQAVCSECASRGYEPWVPRQEAQSRGMVFGAIQGDVYEAIDAHDRGDRNLPRLLRSPQSAFSLSACHRKVGAAPSSATGTIASASTLNRPTVPGALPPSLTIHPVHTARNTGRRSFALMERQQYYTQNDNNLLMRVPESSTKASSGVRRVSKAGKAKISEAHPAQQCITASRNNA